MFYTNPIKFEARNKSKIFWQHNLHFYKKSEPGAKRNGNDLISVLKSAVMKTEHTNLK